MNPQLLLNWWNLIFELPLGLGLLYLAMYTLSGWTFGEADADTDALDHDVDAHLDAHGEIAFDHDADLSHDIDTDADADSDTDHPGSSAFLSALNWVGVGRMPMSLVLMLLLLCWGTIGFVTNQLQIDQPFQRALAISIAIAAVGSICITHFVASLLGRYLFTALNIARRHHQLLGSNGEALYPIDQKFGMVCGRDDRGEHFQVACRIEKGQPPIAKGAPVQLVAYSASERMFSVIPAVSSKTPRTLLATKG